jgi:hypothetical protein
MVYSPITCCAATRWASTAHGMQRPQHKKAVGAFRPLERGVYGVTVVVTPHPVYGTPLIAPVFASQQKRSNEGDKPSDGP